MISSLTFKEYTRRFTFYEIKYEKMYCRPSSIENLLKIEDIAVEKANKYGKEMIERIKSFCQETGAKLDAMPSQVAVTAKVREILSVDARSLNVTSKFSPPSKPLPTKTFVNFIGFFGKFGKIWCCAAWFTDKKPVVCIFMVLFTHDKMTNCEHPHLLTCNPFWISGWILLHVNKAVHSWPQLFIFSF